MILKVIIINCYLIISYLYTNFSVALVLLLT